MRVLTYFSDAILRSSLYSHFSESLSGLATIRAYGEQERFLKDNQKRVDVENRAYWLTVTNQVRLVVWYHQQTSLMYQYIALARNPPRFPRNFADLRRRHFDRLDAVQLLAFTDRCDTLVHHQCSAGIRMDGAPECRSREQHEQRGTSGKLD